MPLSFMEKVSLRKSAIRKSAPTEETPCSISQVSKEFGLTLRALRYYEDKGLIHPERDGVARVYSSNDRARIGIILRCKRVGLMLCEIRDLLNVYETEVSEREFLKASIRKFKQQALELQRKQTEVDDAIDELKSNVTQIQSRLEIAGESSVRTYDSLVPGSTSL